MPSDILRTSSALLLSLQMEVEAILMSEPNWALKLVHALTSPGLAMFLLFLGLIGMYVEIKTPGVGVGGVVAAVASRLTPVLECLP